jgi:predicted ATPase
LLWLTGEQLAADESAAEAIKWAESIDHVGSLSHALDNSLLLSVYKRDLPAVTRYAERLSSLADTYELPEVKAKSSIFSGWARTAEASRAGVREFESGLRMHRSVGTDEDTPLYYSLWADLLMRLKGPTKALPVLTRAIEEAEHNGNLFWLPELYRQRGLANALMRRGQDIGRKDLAKALSIGIQQGAISLVDRARADLLRIESESE